MEECKAELTLKDPQRDTYDVLWEFVNDLNFKYDWLMAGCKNDDTGEESTIEPSYPKGKPKELEGLELERKLEV